MWASEPCKQLRKDKVVQHARSEMHANAIERERLAIASTSDGGIVQAFQATVSLHNIPPSTRFNHLNSFSQLAL